MKIKMVLAVVMPCLMSENMVNDLHHQIIYALIMPSLDGARSLVEKYLE